MAFASTASAAAAICLTMFAGFAAPEAQAIVVNVGGNNYDVTTFTGDYDSNSARFNTIDMPWWVGRFTATAFASAVATGLGLPNAFGIGGPYFAYSVSNGSVDAKGFDSTIARAQDFYPFTYLSSTFAILSPPQLLFSSSSAVPGPLPLVGAAAAIGWSRRLRCRLGAGRRSGLN